MLELASIHVPKTAGTSFRLVLERWYGDALHRVYSPDDLLDLPPTARVAHGHVPAASLEAERHVAWLRDPGARVASHFHFWRVIEPDAGSDDLQRAVHAGTIGLLEFAEHPDVADHVSRHYLSGWSLDRFAFVGISECASPEIGRLARILGQQSVACPRVNPTASGEYFSFLATGEHVAAYEQIRRASPADTEQYVEARARMTEWWNDFAARGPRHDTTIAPGTIDASGRLSVVPVGDAAREAGTAQAVEAEA